MQDWRTYIMQKYNCITFARDVLGWPVFKAGTRVPSLHPGPERGKNLVIYPDFWYDHKEKKGGSVIDLCAWTKFNGDVHAAIQYLAGDFFKLNDNASYTKQVQRYIQDFTEWFSQLRQVDIDYLHSRKITDDTIQRLHIGYSPKHRRLMIPYFKNGDIVYWIGRETQSYELAALRKRFEDGDDSIPTQVAYASPDSTISKYIKAPSTNPQATDSGIINYAWGFHTLSRRYENQQAAFNYSGAKIDKQEWLVIAEGCFDALSFEQEGWSVLSPMGGSFNPFTQREVLQAAKNFQHVLIIFDNDGAGSQFQRRLAQEMFGHRIRFHCGTVPKEHEGIPCKDVSDYYVAGGELAVLAVNAIDGLDYLAGVVDSEQEVKNLMKQSARFADKSDVIYLYEQLKARKIFSPFWLKTLRDEAIRPPSENAIVDEVLARHNLKYIEGLGFHEYVHGVWRSIPDNFVKGYVDDVLGVFATNSRMTSITQFIKSRTSSTESLNTQPVFNLQNGIILLNEGAKFTLHDESYLSSIQMNYNYDPEARCPNWWGWVYDVMNDDDYKISLLQEMSGYILWPNNRLETAFFLCGEGGNGKSVYIDTMKKVFGDDNCTALDLSSLNGSFDPIMLQHSLVNFAAENRVDMKGSEARFKGIVSGDSIVAAHKGIDAIKFTPRCKLITSCNDFVNSNEVTHAFLRRLRFIKFTKNYVQKGKADVNIRDRFAEEIPGIFNWCMEGYRRLLETKSFTETQENLDTKAEFLKSINPAASFIEEERSHLAGQLMDAKELYASYKRWAEDAGLKSLSRNSLTRRLKQLLPQMIPGVQITTRRHVDYFEFPAEGEYQE